MGQIVYKSLSSLTPVELKYSFYKEENLDATLKSYQEGLNTYEIDGLTNFQDVAINKDTCFILTSSIKLDTIFKQEDIVDFSNTSGTIYLQPRNFSIDTSIYYVGYKPNSNSFSLTLTSGSAFFIEPIINSKQVEIFVDSKYLQVNAKYPYDVYLSDRSLDIEEIHRQRFEIVISDNFISFKTKTDSGYRYLALDSTNKLRATGLIFATGPILTNNAAHDYIFKYIPVTTSKLARGFIPENNWVTYFYDIESGQNNKNVTINKDIQNIPTNLLINFPLEEAAEKGTVKINIANLKTSVTPAGGPAPLDNSYLKVTATTN